MRPIDADALHADFINDLLCIKFGSALQGTPRSDIDILNVLERIEEAPTIEAEPVRHGEWLDSGINGTVSCSLCMFTDFFANQNRVMLFKYCPGCGAKMDGGIPDETVHDKK